MSNPSLSQKGFGWLQFVALLLLSVGIWSKTTEALRVDAADIASKLFAGELLELVDSEGDFESPEDGDADGEVATVPGAYGIEVGPLASKSFCAPSVLMGAWHRYFRSYQARAPPLN